VKVFEPRDHNRGAVFHPDDANVKTIDLETSSRVMDLGTEKVVDQDFMGGKKETPPDKGISEVSIILPVTPSEELKEPEEAAPPADVSSTETQHANSQPAEVQTTPDNELRSETQPEFAPAPAKEPIAELTPAPELTPMTEEAPHAQPGPAPQTQNTPQMAPIDEGTPKVQKKPKKVEGSPDELVSKLNDILTVLEKKVESTAASGKDVNEAKKVIAEARDHFNGKRYKSAKELAIKVKQMVA